MSVSGSRLLPACCTWCSEFRQGLVGVSHTQKIAKAFFFGVYLCLPSTLTWCLWRHLRHVKSNTWGSHSCTYKGKIYFIHNMIYALGSQTRIQLHTYSTQRSRETTTFVKNSKNLITKMSPGLFDDALLAGHSCSLTSSRQWPQRSQRAPINQPYCYHVRTKLCGETCFKDVTGTQ